MRTFLSLAVALMLLTSSTYAADSSYSSQQVFTVVVDYSKSLAKMIKAGKYDWIEPEITAEHFPLQGDGRQEVEITLFHFNKAMTLEQAIIEMDSAGFRPAKPPELLALGAAQPDLQRQFPIVALGQFWLSPGGRRNVVVLNKGDAMRDLHFIWFGFNWISGNDDWHFAAVHK